MNWKTIRLELGPTPGFPKGSVGRAFLVRVPIDEKGRIDAEAIKRNPSQATVRRFWASEPDASGKLEFSDGAWVFEPRINGSKSAYVFQDGPFHLNGQISVRGPDGAELPFRVVGIKRLGAIAALKG